MPNPKYSSSLTRMPCADQVNQTTTMVIVHANVVAVTHFADQLLGI